MQEVENSGLTPLERRTTFGLAGVYGVRMLGLFMILPVFALYAAGLEGVTPTLVGLAIGIYGLTQAVFQIPLGMLSDRLGRKPVIVGGLLVFALGSVVAAMSDSITGVIIGRALQGSGAVASATLALVADLTRETIRARVMAAVGLTIGVAFSVAMISGPILSQWIGVDGIFWMIAVFALIAIAIVTFVVPTPVKAHHYRDTRLVSDYLGSVLRDPQLLRLDFGIFTLHMLMMANFVVLPLQFVEVYGVAAVDHWKIYLPVMLGGFMVMVPFIIIAEKYRRMKQMFTLAVAELLLAEIIMYLDFGGLTGLVVGLFVFFVAFNFLEASLPSLVAKLAPADAKGTAMGVYSTSQFFGIFVGGSMGGWMHEHHGIQGVYLFAACIVALWLALAITMKKPGYTSTYVLNVGMLEGQQAAQLADKLTSVAGVIEATVIAGEGTAYLKVDKQRLDEKSLQTFASS
ncbi:MAG: MFS transporter [bacterium]